MPWILENLSFFLCAQCFLPVLPQEFICIVVCSGGELWSSPWSLGACLYPAVIGLELKSQSWKDRFACRVPIPLFVPCHWFESWTPYQMHPCIFKGLYSLKIWTLSVSRCASVSFYHPLFGCVFILCSGQVGFNVLLLWGCGNGQNKIPTRYCKTQNVTAVSKSANAFENSAQNLFHLENKTCNPLGRRENTWFPVCTLTGPACHCSACEVVLVREEKLTPSTSASC